MDENQSSPSAGIALPTWALATLIYMGYLTGVAAGITTALWR